MGSENNPILLKAIEHYGVNPQIDIVIEEMSELTKALLKHRRYGTEDTYKAIREELADVEICLEYIKLIYSIDDKSLEFIKNFKLDRLRKHFESKEFLENIVKQTNALINQYRR